MKMTEVENRMLKAVNYEIKTLRKAMQDNLATEDLIRLEAHTNICSHMVRARYAIQHGEVADIMANPQDYHSTGLIIGLLYHVATSKTKSV